MTPPIMNVADLELRESPVPLPSGLESKLGSAKLGFIGSAIGAKKLGYNLTVVPPERRALAESADSRTDECSTAPSGDVTRH